jgi:hypothetical protein
MQFVGRKQVFNVTAFAQRQRLLDPHSHHSLSHEHFFRNGISREAPTQLG